MCIQIYMYNKWIGLIIECLRKQYLFELVLLEGSKLARRKALFALSAKAICLPGAETFLRRYSKRNKADAISFPFRGNKRGVTRRRETTVR